MLSVVEMVRKDGCSQFHPSKKKKKKWFTKMSKMQTEYKQKEVHFLCLIKVKNLLLQDVFGAQSSLRFKKRMNKEDKSRNGNT